MSRYEAAQVVANLVAERAREAGVHPENFTNTFIRGCTLLYLGRITLDPAAEAAIAANPDRNLVRAMARQLSFEWSSGSATEPNGRG